MRVLQVLPGLEVGGVERGVIDLARAVKKRNEKIVVVSSGGKLVDELRKMGVPHYQLPVHRKALSSLALIPKLAEIIRKEQISVVHARSRVPAWLAWFAARKTGVPFVTTCHGYYSNHLLSRIMGWGHRVIVISRVVGRHMIDDFGVAPERIRLIHRGINLEEFTPKPETANKKDVLRIVNVGRLTPIKGQVEFLKAVHQLRKRIQKIEVLLVGAEAKGKTKYTQKIRQTIKQLGLESCVELLGTRRDVPELIAGADLLVLSTLVPEAFGRVIVEAGAVGTPVVSTCVGGVLDIIEDKVHGRLVPPREPEAMADAMFEILTEPEKAREYARRLAEKVRSEFTLEQMTDKTMAVYKEVLAQKKILIIKLGAMGDLILGTPSFRMIRRRFPDAFISVLVDKALAPLISACPHINEIIPINRKKLSKPGYLLKLAKTLRKEGYDFSVDLQNSKWTHLLAALGGIPQRFGFRRGRLGFLVNRHDRNCDLADSPVKHQFRILSKLGIQELDEDLELWPEKEAEAHVETLLAPYRNGGGGERLVGFAIGASPTWQTKRWPLEFYRDLGARLAKKNGCKMVLIGTEEDREQADFFTEKAEGHYLDFVGKTSTLDLVPLIQRLDVLVTGDTAPLHVASAVRTKFVSIFGPTDPRRHAPPGDGRVLVTKNLACRPCYQGICQEKERLACLRRVSVDEVYDAVSRQLAS